MVDFGLVALILLVAIMAGAVLWAFTSMKREVSSNAKLEGRIEEALNLARAAASRVDQVEVEHYNGLAKRLDGVDVKLADTVRELDSVAGRVRTVQATVAAYKRFDKKEEPPAPAPADELDDLLKQASQVPPAEPAKKTFGRKAT